MNSAPPVTVSRELENDLGTHLQLPRSGGAVRTAHLADNLSEEAVADLVADGSGIVSGVVEVGMVQDVVGLKPQFESDILPDFGSLRHAHVEVDEGGPVEEVSPDCCRGIERWIGKSVVRVREEYFRPRRECGSRRRRGERITHEIGTIDASYAQAITRSEHIERSSRLPREDAGQLEAFKSFPHGAVIQVGSPVTDGQLPDRVQNAYVADVVIGIAAIESRVERVAHKVNATEGRHYRIIGVIDGVGPGVSSLHLEAVRKPLRQLRLQGVVIGIPVTLVQSRRLRRATDGIVKNTIERQDALLSS